MVDNDPLFREMKEELRREQLQKLWENYGSYILAAAVLIVALVGGYNIWQQRQVAFSEASGASYEAALALSRAGKADEAAKAMEAISSSGHRGYATLAELTRAGKDIEAGKAAEALALFDTVAKDSGNDALMRDYAALQAAAVRLGEADFTEMENRLKPLLGDQGAWRFNARELLGYAALKAGKRDEARAAFAPLLSDPSVPSSTLERVRIAMATLDEAKSAASPSPAAAISTPAGDKEPAAKDAADKAPPPSGAPN